jgi:hypothetical protein
MPPATRSQRGQVERYGRQRFDQAAPPFGSPALSISNNSKPLQQSNAAHHAPARIFD